MGDEVHSAKELGRHVQPSVDDARLDRQWAGVAELSKRRSVSWQPVALALAALTTCLVVGFLLFERAQVRVDALEGASIDTSGASTQRLTLADGSQVDVAAASHITLANARPDRVHIVLTRGSMALDVTHKPERSFIVSVGGFDVIVRGTRFRVVLGEGAANSLTVAVDEGRVEARRRDSTEPGRFIGAGESWTTASSVTPPAASVAIASEPVTGTSAPEPSADPSETADVTSMAPAPGASAPRVGKEPARDAFSELLAHKKYKEAFATLGPGDFKRTVQESSARRLLELADAARLAGRAREAAEALDKLRRTYRSDARAGLAALELGRLRMDALGNAAGALEAFEDAVALAPGGAVREDAEARRVQALDALGRTSECVRARDAYLAAFPSGTHAASIRGRCVAK
jgi:hypothetical protein